MIIKNKILLSLFITLSIVLLIKLVLPDHKSFREITDEFWFNKTHGTTKYNIVVGGNSRIYRGVSINSLLGSIDKNLTGVNLGFSSAGYSTEYLDFLYSRLDMAASDKFILLGITPGSFTEKAALNKHYNEIKKISESEILKKSYLKKYLDLEPYKPTELISILKRQNGYIEEESGYYSRYNESGWVASYKLASDSTEALSKYQKYYEPEEVIINQTIVNEFVQKVSEFIDQDIHVIAFRPPTTIQLEVLENELLKFDEDLIKNKLTETGCIWVDINSTDFNSYDGSHLHYLSAEKLSVQLGDVIQGVCFKK